MTNFINWGGSRRHFLSHLAGAATWAASSSHFVSALRASAPRLQNEEKSAILLWMGGGPSTIDMWDLKPDAPTGGPFRPISTTGDIQICEHLPRLAQQMHRLSVIRSLSTREADHQRGLYYMKTGFVPNPSVQHPSYGAVVSHELAPTRENLAIPPFVSVGGGSVGAGFLGMSHAPFVVQSNGRVRNLQANADRESLARRMAALELIETQFARQNRGRGPLEHGQVLSKTWEFMTSQQMAAFRLDSESPAVRERYGNTGFGNGCLLARRLVEAGVPFVEVNFSGWDTHANNFTALENKLPEMDQAMSALVEDLAQRGRWEQTAVLWLGEFGRTPRINGNAGRDHWATAWSAVAGGAGIQGGTTVGSTNKDGTAVDSESYGAEDLMASILHALEVPLTTVHKSLSGRPMKIANGGQPIPGLFS